MTKCNFVLQELSLLISVVTLKALILTAVDLTSFDIILFYCAGAQSLFSNLMMWVLCFYV